MSPPHTAVLLLGAVPVVLRKSRIQERLQWHSVVSLPAHRTCHIALFSNPLEQTFWFPCHTLLTYTTFKAFQLHLLFLQRVEYFSHVLCASLKGTTKHEGIIQLTITHSQIFPGTLLDPANKAFVNWNGISTYVIQYLWSWLSLQKADKRWFLSTVKPWTMKFAALLILSEHCHNLMD